MTRHYIRKNTPGREHDLAHGQRRVRKCVSNDPVIQNLFRAVVDSGLTDSQIEVRSGVTAKAMHGWFSGTRSPTLVTLTSVAQTVGCTITIREYV